MAIPPNVPSTLSIFPLDFCTSYHANKLTPLAALALSFTYTCSFADEALAERKAIYEDNVAYINAHNQQYAAGKATFDMGVNEFSHMSHEEFKAM